MDLHSFDANRRGADDYLFGRGQAWFALAMTLALMIFDYVDRQVIVSLFPYLKAAWDRRTSNSVRWFPWCPSRSRWGPCQWRCSQTGRAG
jgi:hypothetical protein